MSWLIDCADIVSDGEVMLLLVLVVILILCCFFLFDSIELNVTSM